MLLLFGAVLARCIAGEDAPATFVNSAGLEMKEVQAGTFLMGSEYGEWDEAPVRRVVISRPFHLSVREVTNAQFELFDPNHRIRRGERTLSVGDDEAVVFVSWEEAVAFCEWLSRKEGRHYRLPTEAEWEYVCRAGTATAFVTGDDLPVRFQKHQESDWQPHSVSLRGGETPANPWGFFDLHGNVEEWCADWYGPYGSDAQVDPRGPAGGTFRVTRGGSHNTEPIYLRSANRSGTLPTDRSWMIGFRVVLGAPLAEEFSADATRPEWRMDVSQGQHAWEKSDVPVFRTPVRFVRVPADADGPLYSKHNHQPSITWCDNGDLLAVWFSTRTERGREMTVAASRFRAGAEEWDPAAEFFKAPDRNMTGVSLFNDGRGTILHFNGLEAAGRWANLALVLRASRDSGATWSTPRLINPRHQPRNQVISGTSMTPEGWLLQPCDAVFGGQGGTAVHISRDGGHTWIDPGAGSPAPYFSDGEQGGTIAGIHAGVVALKDGRWLAYGRGNDIRGRMPQSISADHGATWTYSASPWPPISSGQRLVLTRLREGALLLCSFTDNSRNLENPSGMRFQDSADAEYVGYGLFAAISHDEGVTWPVKKLITESGESQTLDGGAWTGAFTMDATHAEPKGYLAVTQSPDGVIHLLSSALHYRFNLAWLHKPSAPAPRETLPSLPAE